MNETDKSLISLFIIGVLIAVGKVLAGGESITFRLFVGRILLGGFVSMIAGVALVQFPDLSPLAINGIGAALGIAGYQTIELLIQRRARQMSDKTDSQEKPDNE
ncbi:phage holin family protein [Pectobacteriaceae bacterium CE90]|uniref:phage holin family protein n=1 Tax=Brenneria uluponensis TaxID=3057057 RepID=UPI0025B34DDD|nr:MULTISPECIES: phage holin family protein [Pectobacteriaceae]WJV57298.1 phage holin family protein [Pectobacteriaceae bacterium C111]WJY14490.1 phage holin family protein [Pectobacteriaceae bacterium CE90]WJV52943.1 phage holin family protein [Prodigiosinella sp. LS101]WJV54472.1 phage holin family protein [Prodigiosinella sp. LS101]WJV58834.1 phage holin family protein [Pectobacteriaceae bacterium C111]